MTVEQILAKKGRAVTTITADKTLAEAIALLASHKIGALIVASNHGAIEGIISERDIVRELAREGEPCLHEPVSRYMTIKVITCTGIMPVTEVMELMTNGKFRHVPVVDNGLLAGLISIGDVVKHRLAEIEAEHDALRHYIATA
jgi:CBS domain-containing protein